MHAAALNPPKTERSLNQVGKLDKSHKPKLISNYSSQNFAAKGHHAIFSFIGNNLYKIYSYRYWQKQTLKEAYSNKK